MNSNVCELQERKGNKDFKKKKKKRQQARAPNSLVCLKAEGPTAPGNATTNGEEPGLQITSQQLVFTSSLVLSHCVSGFGITAVSFALNSVLRKCFIF